MEENLEAYLKQCVSIDPLSLSEEFTKVASELSFWNERQTEALRASLHAKIARERLHAQLFFEKRAALEAAKAKATEATVEAAIEIDPRFAALRDEEADAQSEYMRLRGVAEAVKTKRDMLVSLGAHVRAEMAGDPSTKNPHSATEDDDL